MHTNACARRPDARNTRTHARTRARTHAHTRARTRRSGEGFDSGLLDSVRDKVTVYSTPLGDAQPFTTLEAAVGSNQILRESRLGSNLALWVGGRTAGGMRVHLCRPEAAAETQCGDGRDNDCDGYTDADDADCRPGVGPAAGGAGAGSSSGRLLLQLQDAELGLRPWPLLDRAAAAAAGLAGSSSGSGSSSAGGLWPAATGALSAYPRL
jgi:hypothetical protein